MFEVGTERDHVAPWRSVYKIHYITDTDVTFVLTSGGHNAGIVSDPGRPAAVPDRHQARRDPCLGARNGRWRQGADGSWWVEWAQWLADRSTPSAWRRRLWARPRLRADRRRAGTYVFQR